MSSTPNPPIRQRRQAEINRFAEEDKMNPQMTYLLAAHHARDIRHDAEKRSRAATPGKTSERRGASVPLPGTVVRPSLLRRLRLA
jgi:hypothetical protein